MFVRRRVPHLHESKIPVNTCTPDADVVVVVEPSPFAIMVKYANVIGIGSLDTNVRMFSYTICYGCDDDDDGGLGCGCVSVFVYADGELATPPCVRTTFVPACFIQTICCYDRSNAKARSQQSVGIKSVERQWRWRRHTIDTCREDNTVSHTQKN